MLKQRTKMKKIICLTLIAVILVSGFWPAVVHGQTTTVGGITTVGETAGESAPRSIYEAMPDCGVFGLGGTIMGCLAQLGYYFFFGISSFVFNLMGKLLDFTFFYSVDSASYTSPFVSEGWGIIRDLANLLFILILVYLGIKIILNLGASEAKKMISTIIVVALLLNFSLFFAKIVIDGGNILARVFYNAITVKDPNGQPVTGDKGEKSISIALASKFDPQKLISPDFKVLYVKTKNGGVVPVQLGPNAYAGFFTLITLIASVVNLAAAWAFFIIAILLIVRVLGLWLAMIFAPLAFISYIIPKLPSGSILPSFGHESWWKDLLGFSLLAPVFMFFMYLIVLFLEKGLIGQGSFNTDTTLGKILNIVFPLLITIILIKQARDTAKKMAGELGETGIGLVKKAVGIAGGAVLGAISIAGVGLIGRGAAMVLGRAGGAGAAEGAAAGAAEKEVARVPLKEIPTGPPARPKPGAPPEAPIVTPPSPLGETPSPYGPRPAPEVPPEAPPPEAPPPEAPPAEAVKEEEFKPEEAEVRLKEIAARKEEIDKEIAENEQKGVGAGFGAAQRRERNAELRAEKDKLNQEQKTIEDKLKGKKIEWTVSYEEKRAKTLKDYASEKGFKGWLARGAVRTLDNLQKSSFDLRNLKAFKMLERYTGIDFGEARGKGGFEALQKRRIEKDLAFAKLLQPSAGELKELRKISSELAQMRLKMSKYNEKDYFEVDEKGNVKRDKDGNRIAKAGADKTVVDNFAKLDEQMAKFNAEKQKVNNIYAERLLNSAKVAESGRGMNWILSGFGKYSSMQGMESAAKIREAAESLIKGGPAFQEDTARKILDRLAAMEKKIK